MKNSKDLFFQANIALVKEQIIELGVSLTLPLLREISIDRYETVENLHVVTAAKELYSNKESKYETTGAYVITKNQGIMFQNVDVVCIDNPLSAKEELEKAAPTVEPQPEPVVANVEQKAAPTAPEAPKTEAKPKKEKATTAKAGGVKSKEKPIVDMNAAELKALAKKNTIDFSTVNFRKVDEKDAFRSKLAKALGRSNELNYSVK